MWFDLITTLLFLACSKLHVECVLCQAIWLPGSQTELAVVTADFVKIYDLSVDAISPQYYFLLPSGKIRDATFLMSDNERYLLLMSSTGYICEQVMDSSSGAQHGQFFITNVLDVKHPDVKVTCSYQLIIRVGRALLYRLSLVDAHTVAQNQYTGKKFDNIHFFCHGIVLCAEG